MASRGGGREGFRSGGGGRGGRGGFKQRSMLHTGSSFGEGSGSKLGSARSDASKRRLDEQSFDDRMGFERLKDGPERIGYLFHMLPTVVTGEDRIDRAGLDMYFIEQDGTSFKGTITHEPYFYIALAGDGGGDDDDDDMGDDGGGGGGPSSVVSARVKEVLSVLEKEYQGLLSGIAVVEKEDLEMLNHLSGRRREYIKLSFRNASDQTAVRMALKPLIEQNAARAKRGDVLGGGAGAGAGSGRGSRTGPLSALVDIREYDVNYTTRVSIDRDVRVGKWYRVAHLKGTPAGAGAAAAHQQQPLAGVELARVEPMPPDFVVTAEPRILAWDIETTKAPLKFPDARVDQVYMVSYMLDTQGFLLINREVVGGDVADFEYTPLPEFKGPFTVHNLQNEEAVLRHFIAHIQVARPQIYVTYNGDFFDWPFVDARCGVYGIDLRREVGVGRVGFDPTEPSEYRGRTAVHVDCLYWVKRDSYLPQGSQGLKAVTKAKLGYDPVEIDPEDMLPMAASNPQHMASYSVSDAVATYYLYQQYIHNFIFSLATIIPMNSDDVLRKGSGTLCESLLMVEAYHGNIVCPNKQVDAIGATYNGHLLEAETYLGGHVECLETGVYRSDIPYAWKLVPAAFDTLIAKIDAALTFAIEVEFGLQRRDVTNYHEVRAAITERLEALRDDPCRSECPVIYHLDVAAMYPNIILTNRLQPSSIVASPDVCGACDYNDDANRCKRTLQWRWRGEYFPASKAETNMIRAQLANEAFGEERTPYVDLPRPQQQELLKARLKLFCQRAHKRVKDTVETDKHATICQRENPFYVNTVRAFRDRRYEYKGKTKEWSKKLAAAEKSGAALDAELARARVVLYDSLQLAHKCILNSFYGYVMRRGARWHSMEMAGVVTYTGSTLIQQARSLVEQVGRPLELDTDGIWCILPKSFPDRFAFTTTSGGKLPINYPCVMLNADVHERYTNHQYQELVPASAPGGRPTYTIRSECSIFFELDGPYAAMVLPASQEEGKLLKKRYAVFHDDGSLAELKGFELKRRGELKIVKVFQQQVFERFLDGSSLEECYRAVGSVADYWLDVLDTQGEDLDDGELLDLLAENRSMSRTLEDYGDQKSVAISTAKRLSEFLGSDMVKDKGLACKLLVAKKPAGAPVTERAIPVSIFDAEPDVKRHFLRKWCKDSSMTDFDLRSLLDWEYYTTRLLAAVQKIITIPAALQGVSNPVPRAVHPEWLERDVRRRASAHLQRTITGWIAGGVGGAGAGKGASASSSSSGGAMDIEDGVPGGVGEGSPSGKGAGRATTDKAKLRRLALGATPPAPAMDTTASGSSGPPLGPAHEPVPPAPPLSAKPTPEELAAWIASRRATWRALTAEKKRRRMQALGRGGDGDAGGGEASVSGAGGKGRSKAKGKPGAQTKLSGFVTVAASAGGSSSGVTHASAWQLLEIRHHAPSHASAAAAAAGGGGADPGQFQLLVLTAPRRLQSVTMEVPRRFYVAARKFIHKQKQRAAAPPPPGAGDDDGMHFLARHGRLVRSEELRLPRDAIVPVLYSVSMPERRFQRLGGAGVARGSLHSDPDILGVYETATPLALRPLVQLGLVSRLSAVKRMALVEAAAAAARAAGAARMARQKKDRAARAAAAASSFAGKGKRGGKGKLPSLAAPALSIAPAAAASASAAGAVAPRRQSTLTLVRPAGASPAAHVTGQQVDGHTVSEEEVDGHTVVVIDDEAPEVGVSSALPAEGSGCVPSGVPGGGSQSHSQSPHLRPEPLGDGAPAGEDLYGGRGDVPDEGRQQHDSEGAREAVGRASASQSSVPLTSTQSLLEGLGGYQPPAGGDGEDSMGGGSMGMRGEEEGREGEHSMMQGASPASDVRTGPSAGSPSSGGPAALTAPEALDGSDVDAVERTDGAASAPPPSSSSAGNGANNMAPVESKGRRGSKAGVATGGGARSRGVSLTKGAGRGGNAGSSLLAAFAKAAAAAPDSGLGGAGATGVSGGDTLLTDPYGLSANPSGGASTFTLEDFERDPASASAISHYLDPNGAAVYRRAFLFHSGHLQLGLKLGGGPLQQGGPTGRTYSLTGLFIIQESDSSACETWVREAVATYAAQAGIAPGDVEEGVLQSLRAQVSTAIPGLQIPVTLQGHFFVTSSGAPVSSSSSSSSSSRGGGPGRDRDKEGGAAPRAPVLGSIFASVVAQFVESQGGHYPAALHNQLPQPKFVVCDKPADVWRRVSLLLSDNAPGGGPANPPLLLLSCTPFSKTDLLELMPAATARIPVIPVPYVHGDLRNVVPLTGWEATLARRACRAWADSLAYWRDLLPLAKYGAVPIANMGEMVVEQYGYAWQAALSSVTEAYFATRPGLTLRQISATLQHMASTFVLPLPPLEQLMGSPLADLSLSRVLTSQHHVLWYSTQRDPDLGGAPGCAASTSETASLAQWYAGAVATGDIVSLLGSHRVGASAGGWDGSTGAAGSGRMSRSTGAGAGGQSEGHSLSASAVTAGGAGHVVGAPTGEPGKGSLLIGPCANPVLSWPGCYRCVCFQLRLDGLAVNTVLNSDALDGDDDGGGGSSGDGALASAAYEQMYDALVRAAREGADAAAAFDGALAGALVHMRPGDGDVSGGAGGDAASSCMGAYKALRSLVALWRQDARNDAGHNGTIARSLLGQFYTWLAAPSSALHEPALHRLVQRQMRSVFEALLKGLKASGCGLVFASFNSLVVALPGRTNREAAWAALRTAVTKLTSQPLFCDLDVSPVRAFRSLVWYDEANHCGVSLALQRAPFQGPDGALVEPPPLPSATQRDERVVESMVGALLTSPYTDDEGAHLLSREAWEGLEKAYVSAHLHAPGERVTYPGEGGPGEDDGDGYTCEHQWSLGDYLTAKTRPVFKALIESWLMYPLRGRARRAFRRLRDRFVQHAQGAINDACLAAAAAAPSATSSSSPLLGVSSASGTLHVGRVLLGRSHGAVSLLEGRLDDAVALAEAGLEGEGGAMTGTPRTGRSQWEEEGRARGQGEDEGGDEEGGDGTGGGIIPSTPVDDGGAGAAAPSSCGGGPGALGFTSQRGPSITRGLVLARVLGAGYATTTGGGSAGLTKAEEGEEAKADVEALRSFVGGRLQERMFQTLMDLAAGGAGDVEDTTDDLIAAKPWRGGGSDTHHHSGMALWRRCALPGAVARPSLQYVKTALAMLGLDDRLRHELDVLRSTLLRQLGVRDFSAEARFSDPCGTVVLPDVVCPSCASCVDHLDLARDPHLRITFLPVSGQTPSSEEDEYDEDGRPRIFPHGVAYTWACRVCGAAYDTGQLELALVEIAQYRSACFMTQDAACVKCSRVRGTPAEAHCECAGRYRSRESVESFRAAMRVYRTLAERFNFRWLLEELAVLQ